MASKHILIAALAAATLAAQAQQTAPLPPAKPVALPAPAGHAIDEIIRMEAELERINKRAAIKEAQKKLSGDAAMPVVQAIIMDGSGPTARIRYESGLMRTVRVGEMVAGHGRITAIDASGVRVASGRESIYLPFHATVPTAAPAPTPTPVLR